MEDWEKKRAELEREVLELKRLITRYEGTLRPHREVTESEYKSAKRRLIEAATALQQGDYEAKKPTDPLVDMSLAQLKEFYKKEKENYKGGAGSSRQCAKLLRIQTKIQQKENEKMEG